MDAEKRHVSIVLALILVLVVAAFSIYYFQSQSTIGRLQANPTFSQSTTLLPKMNVTLRACSQIGCYSGDTWSWNFPYNKSLESPGYLNITVYRTNNTGGIMGASWSYDNSNGSGYQSWDYTTGVYPRTTPGWMIVPVIKGMIALTISVSPQSYLASWQTISISYYY
jgi:hypothetical protein